MLNLSFVKALLDVNSFPTTSRKLVSFYDVNVISFAHFLGSIISCCLVNKRALVPPKYGETRLFFIVHFHQSARCLSKPSKQYEFFSRADFTSGYEGIVSSNGLSFITLQIYNKKPCEAG